MSQGINITSSLYVKLKQLKGNKSFSEIIEELINQNLQEATISQAGQLSKTMAGKTILYRLKDQDGVTTHQPQGPETLSGNTNP